MAIRDALRLRKFNKLYNQVWALVWERAQAISPAEENAVAHLCFVGTLIYGVRYQVGLKVGMDESFARTLAIMAIDKAGYDKDMEDAVNQVFSGAADDAAKAYVSPLYAWISAVIEGARHPESAAGEGLHEELEKLWSCYARLYSEQTSRPTDPEG